MCDARGAVDESGLHVRDAFADAIVDEHPKRHREQHHVAGCNEQSDADDFADVDSVCHADRLPFEDALADSDYLTHSDAFSDADNVVHSDP